MLSRAPIGDGGSIREDQREHDPLAVLLCRGTDLADRQRFPVLRRHFLVRVIDGDRRVAERLEAVLGEDLIGGTIDAHRSNVGLADLVASVKLDASTHRPHLSDKVARLRAGAFPRRLQRR
jgi:hypothetical protein